MQEESDGFFNLVLQDPNATGKVISFEQKVRTPLEYFEDIAGLFSDKGGLKILEVEKMCKYIPHNETSTESVEFLELLEDRIYKALYQAQGKFTGTKDDFERMGKIIEKYPSFHDLITYKDKLEEEYFSRKGKGGINADYSYIKNFMMLTFECLEYKKFGEVPSILENMCEDGFRHAGLFEGLSFVKAHPEYDGKPILLLGTRIHPGEYNDEYSPLISNKGDLLDMPLVCCNNELIEAISKYNVLLVEDKQIKK